MQILATDYTQPDAPQRLVQSLRETGFAILVNHPLSNERLMAIYDDWREFFYSDAKTPHRFDREAPEGSREGWYPAEVSETAVGSSRRDLKEYFQLSSEAAAPEALAEDILGHRARAFALGQELLGWIDAALPQEIADQLEEPFAKMASIDASLLRVLHYFPLTGEEEVGAERAAAHEDINLITLLPVAEQAGLQVLDKEGNWIDVDSKRGELVINSGDMLSEATAGYFPSTTHRVVNPGGGIANQSRIAVPFFVTPRLDVRLSDRHTAGSYLNERINLILRNTQGIQIDVKH